MVSIIYVNWNSLFWIKASIEAIKKHPPKTKYEIVIIDNGSELKDGVAEFCKMYPEFIYIFNKENMGFGFACNQGILASKGKYVCFLNGDTEPSEGWLDMLVEYLDAHPECGLAAPSMPNVCQELQSFERNKGEIVSPRSTVPFACVVIPRVLFAHLGLLAMFWGEDVEFCKRLLSRGFALIIVGKAYVFHHGGKCIKGNNVGYNVPTITEYLKNTVYLRLVGE